MNVAVDTAHKFDDWPDENPWTPASMFTSAFGEGVPIPDTQFWASPGNNLEEYYRADSNKARQELGHNVGASGDLSTGYTINGATEASTFVPYNQQLGAQSNDHRNFNDPFATPNERHGAEDDAVFDNDISSPLVGTSTISNKRFPSWSPETTKFSPQSISEVSPVSPVNWVADGGPADRQSSLSPASSVNINVDHAHNSSSTAPIKHKRNRERNRVAAHKCRQKAKQSMSDLQIRERELSQQNRVLQEHAGNLKDEILDLKNEILRHSDCHSDIIQNYIAKAARDVN